MTRGKRWILACAATLVVGSAGAVAVPLLSGRTENPEFSRDSARRALERARDSGAAKWAPSALDAAEARWREAQTELRRQEVRLLPLRDFRGAREQLRSAESAAQWAVELAERARRNAGDDASLSLERCRAVLDATVPLLDAFRFDRHPAALLRKSRIHLDEAEAYRGSGEFGLARIRAEQALLEAQQARTEMFEAVSRYVDADNLARWSHWVRQTIAWSRKTGKPAILVDKDAADLTLYVGGRAVHRYEAEIGRNHLAPKLVAGDLATPEGRYNVVAKKGKGRSKYHAALELDYPNADDLARFRAARASGELRGSDRPGALIEIHGEGGRGWDWTDGCIALTNADVERLLAAVPIGTPVAIVGSAGQGGRFSTVAHRLAKD